MNAYKVVLQKRMKYMRWYLEVMLACYVSGAVFVRKQLGSHLDFVSGVLLGITFLILMYLYRVGSTLKSDEKMKAMYIEEHDERNALIKMQMGKIGIYLVLAGLSCGTLIAGFFNQMIFFTLLGATMFTALVMGVLKLYYRQKW